MKYTVIIPVYNVASCLRACIASVLKASRQHDVEILCVDDGSTDGSGDILDSYDELEVIHRRNGGVSSARNLALEKAKGDYVLFVDGDDGLILNVFEVLDGIIADTKADVIKFRHASVGLVDDDRRGSDAFIYRLYYLDRPMDAGAGYKAFAGSLIAWNGCYKRAAIGDLRFNPELSNGEDVLFGVEFFCRAQRVVSTDAVLYQYLKRPGSAVRTMSSKHLKSVCRMVQEMCRGRVGKWVKQHGQRKAFCGKMRSHLLGEVLPKISRLPSDEQEEVWGAFFDALGMCAWSALSRSVASRRSRAFAKVSLMPLFKARTFASKWVRDFRK